MNVRLANAFRALLLLLAPAASAHAQLIVHEWGTMTTLHAPDGTPQTRLNLIEPAEVLPEFVAHFEPPQPEYPPFAPFGKGVRTPGRPDVTMRLETPVLYFYDPGNVVAGRGFDVRVRMQGGVLNDFYPLASAGMQRNGIDQGRRAQAITLDGSWAGTLEWKDVMLDDTAVVPTTSAAVWLAPRQVRATKVRVGKQAEHYLFYRGLANLGAVLDTYADEAQAMLETWQASYFRKPGLRIFYMTPRAWTDYFLPLELSVPHESTRVLVGRIDLMTAGETT